MDEPQLLENPLLRIFRISRGMCDICSPFLNSVPLGWPQPLPPAVRLALFFSAVTVYGAAIPWKWLLPPHWAQQVLSLYCVPSLEATSVLLTLGSHLLASGIPEHHRSQICTVVHGRVAEKRFLLFVLDSGKGDPVEGRSAPCSFAPAAIA